MVKSAVVLGGGESGTWSAVLASQQGYHTFLSDRSTIDEAFKGILLENEIDFEENGHTTDRILAADLIIKSPGVPPTAPIMQKIKESNLPVLSEIEWAFQFQDKKTIGITGSNGKTTTTRLLTHMLNVAGIKARAVGNIGDSLARSVAEGELPDVLVVELSSFQLEDIEHFKTNVSILLNITPDHLDRYNGDIHQYANAKMNIIKNNNAADLIIYNVDDQIIHTHERLAASKAEKTGIRIESWDTKGFQDNHGNRFSLQQSELKGRHNAFNTACAATAAKWLGLSNEDIQKAIDTFVNEAHRLESVGEFNEVLYINDSKATNVESVYFALEAMNRPVIWIVGGQDKGNDYSPLVELVQNKIKAIVALGVDNNKIIDFFSVIGKPIFDTHSMKDAVNQSISIANAGDVVLLSPACASFDLFNNYIHRGEMFKELVHSKKNM